MKKILLASTALVLSAGVAAAEVKISGDGWMGLFYNGNAAGTPAVASTAGQCIDNVAGTIAAVAAGAECGAGTTRIAGTAGVAAGAVPSKTQMQSRARVTFTLSGETDGGLAFGGSFRADNAGGAAVGTAGSVFISGDFGKLSMGDVDTALRATQFRTRHLGVLENHGGARTGNGSRAAGTSALYEYTMDGLKIALSAGQVGTKAFGAGVQYKFDGFGVGLGYNITEAAGVKTKEINLSGEATFDGISTRASYLQATTAGVKTTNLGLDVRAKFDAVEVGFNAVRNKVGAAPATNVIGLGANYDLGGGATFGAAVSKATGAKALADVGIAFKF
jgi:outer membrane protein OmpU